MKGFWRAIQYGLLGITIPSTLAFLIVQVAQADFIGHLQPPGPGY